MTVLAILSHNFPLIMYLLCDEGLNSDKSEQHGVQWTDIWRQTYEKAVKHFETYYTCPSP